MSGNIRYVSTYQSDLGYALFSENDFHSKELRSIVGELHHLALTNGLQPDLGGISQILGDFLPANIRENPVKDDWYQRDLEKWTSIQKPVIVALLEDYFINGGKENDSKNISLCLELIESHGITIEGKDRLIHEMSCGNWRSKLVMMAQRGREIGIRFFASRSNPENREELSASLKKQHGFSCEEAMWICGSVVLQK